MGQKIFISKHFCPLFTVAVNRKLNGQSFILRGGLLLNPESDFRKPPSFSFSGDGKFLRCPISEFELKDNSNLMKAFHFRK